MAKEYTIEIEEVLSKRINITADSKEAALIELRKQYYNEDIVLTEGDFTYVGFKVVEEKDLLSNPRKKEIGF